MNVKVKFQNKILTLDIEGYVKGVLPNEIPSTYEYNALLAQAIAIRSYTCYQILIDKKHSGFDMCSSPKCCQMFDPKARDLRSDAAVDDCQDWIMVYGRYPVMAMYHASCGGNGTLSALEVFGKFVPYLQTQVCLCGIEKKGHGVGMCQKGAQQYALKGFSFEKILRVYYGDKFQLRTIGNL